MSLRRWRLRDPQTAEDRLTSVRNHLLYAELELDQLRSLDPFFGERYGQVKAMRLEFELRTGPSQK